MYIYICIYISMHLHVYIYIDVIHMTYDCLDALFGRYVVHKLVYDGSCIVEDSCPCTDSTPSYSSVHDAKDLCVIVSDDDSC